MENEITTAAVFTALYAPVLAAGVFTMVREAPRVRARYGFNRISTAGIRVELAGLAGIVASVIGAVL